MPPAFVIDIANIDLNARIHGKDDIRAANPHRFEFEMLDAIIWVERETDSIIGVRDIGEDEFWVRGHIPGRPLFPGVLMIETAAQLASFYVKQYKGWKGFIGFGGTDEVRFRAQVTPGQRLIVLCKQIWERRRMVCCQCQGLVDGSLVFEAKITGVEF